MKAIAISLLLSTAIISSTVIVSNLDKPYSPTRQEWLELSAFKTIKTLTDPWETRIHSSIWIKENTIFVTITEANGEEPLTASSRKEYVNIVEKALKSLVSDYDWSKNLNVHVQSI